MGGWEGLYGRPRRLVPPQSHRRVTAGGTASDHKGPPRPSQPPSPLQMLMGLSLGWCVLGPIYGARGVGGWPMPLLGLTDLTKVSK